MHRQTGRWTKIPKETERQTATYRDRETNSQRNGWTKETDRQPAIGKGLMEEGTDR